MYSQCSSRYKINGKQECIPVGYVPLAAVAIVGSASVHAGIHTPRCGPADTPLLGVGLDTHTPSQVWAWRPTPLGVGLETPQVWAWRPPWYGPGDPPRCGPGDPLQPDPSTSPLGVGLVTCKAYPPRDLQGMLGYHPLPMWAEFLTHASENITLPQTSFAGGKNSTFDNNWICNCYTLPYIFHKCKIKSFTFCTFYLKSLITNVFLKSTDKIIDIMPK